ncbi:MAG TPA: hypothetical protein VGD98_24840 [Ktedonobacteraceae bacterium]
MWHMPFSEKITGITGLRAKTWVSLGITCLSWILLVSLLAACGSNTGTNQQASSSRSSRYGSAPAATSAQTPISTPTPVPPAPTPTAAPPQGAPALLDLRPASMSFVGHLDCQSQTAYVCTAEVSSRASNQSNLHWHAYTNIPGKIVFSPTSGVLTPGTNVLVHITIPFNDCTQGLFFFQGPVNTHTITWAC